VDCIFCRIAAGEIPCNPVLENEHVIAFHDLNPQAPVHVLVIPKRHVENVASAAPTDAELLGRVLLACREAAERCGVAAGGYRVALNSGADGGQTVAHLHAHVLGGRHLGWPPG
jgi:histidine triad (HIT) family protein